MIVFPTFESLISVLLVKTLNIKEGVTTNCVNKLPKQSTSFAQAIQSSNLLRWLGYSVVQTAHGIHQRSIWLHLPAWWYPCSLWYRDQRFCSRRFYEVSSHIHSTLEENEGVKTLRFFSPDLAFDLAAWTRFRVRRCAKEEDIGDLNP